jgi:hypothetical protein
VPTALAIPAVPPAPLAPAPAVHGLELPQEEAGGSFFPVTVHPASASVSPATQIEDLMPE